MEGPKAWGLESFQVGEHTPMPGGWHYASPGTEARVLKTLPDLTLLSLHLAIHLYPLKYPL